MTYLDYHLKQTYSTGLLNQKLKQQKLQMEKTLFTVSSADYLDAINAVTSKTYTKEEAINLGLLTAEQFDEWVRPEDMVGSLK